MAGSGRVFPAVCGFVKIEGDGKRLMERSTLSGKEGAEEAMAELSELRRFSGTPAQFWAAFLSASGKLCSATKATLVLRDPKQPDTWKRLGDWSGPESKNDRLNGMFTRRLVDAAKSCESNGALIDRLDPASQAPPDGTSAPHIVGVRLLLSRPEDLCIAVFLLGDVTRREASEAAIRVQLIADTPASYLLSQSASQARADVEKFAASLDLMVEVNAEKRFLAAALAFCNGLATRHHCGRVSLGWLEREYIRLRAISRTEKFDRHMSAVRSLETAMEEALDQDEEVVWPAPEDNTLVNRDHEAFAREQDVRHLCSVPLRLEDKPIAVVTLERQDHPFNPVEMQQFRLICDQAVVRLNDLKRTDRWFGARLALATREKLSKVLGPEHTWWKVVGCLGVVAMIFLFLVPFNYRVEGNFILQTDEVAYLSVPFAGYIDSVEVQPGDLLKEGDVMLRLDTGELELEEAAAIADFNRFEREAEKAEAARSLAEMRIARAQAQQAAARLEAARYRLGKASIRAPFDSVVTEGELRERIGAPVQPGDSLFKVSRLDKLYVEAEVNERDIHEIVEAGTGELAFVSKPREKLPIKIERVEPAAVPKDGENVFMVRCELQIPPEPWWRPGMSGLVKLDAGRHNLFWILTHRTVDFLRLWMWW